MSEVGVKKEEEEVKEEELASDSAVLLRLKEILKTVDLDVTTEKMLRSTLEVESGRSLVHLKAEIRKEVRHRSGTRDIHDQIARTFADRDLPGLASGS